MNFQFSRLTSNARLLRPTLATMAVALASYELGSWIGTKSPSPVPLLSLMGVGLVCILLGPTAFSFLATLAATIPQVTIIPQMLSYATGLLDRNITPMGTMTVFVGLSAGLMLLFDRVEAVRYVVRRCWGLKYVAIYLLLAVILTPFYSDKTTHIQRLNWQFLIPILAVLAAITTSKSDLFRLARLQLAAVFYLSLVAYTYVFITGQQGLLRSEVFGSGSETYSRMMVGVAGWSNESAAMLLVLLPIGLAALHRLRRGAIWEWLVLLFSTYLLILLGTRATWIGYPIVLAVYFVGTRPKQRGWLILGLIAVIAAAAVVLIPAITIRFSEISDTGGTALYAPNNLAWRLTGTVLTGQFVLDNPPAVVIGLGGGSWERVARQIGLPESVDTAHNLWSNQFVDGGLLAVVPWLLFWGSFFYGACRTTRSLPLGQRLWPVAGVASMIGLFTWSLAANFQFYGGPVLTVLVALLTWSSATVEQTAPDAS